MTTTHTHAGTPPDCSDVVVGAFVTGALIVTDDAGAADEVCDGGWAATFIVKVNVPEMTSPSSDCAFHASVCAPALAPAVSNCAVIVLSTTCDWVIGHFA